MIDFTHTYNRAEFLNFLQNEFLPDDFKLSEEGAEDGKSALPRDFAKIKHIAKLGEVSSLGENKQYPLAVFEVEHESENDPRVTLTKEAFHRLRARLIDRALIIFYSRASANYRFSLMRMDFRASGKRVVADCSNPRRYSFFLGPDSKPRTPRMFLCDKGKVRDWEDLTGRFSIEPVNKEFYDYIAYFFNQLVGGSVKHKIKIKAYQRSLDLPSVDSSNKRIYQEFAARLIGRIIFVWFLKHKKSAAGIPLVPHEFVSSRAVREGYYHGLLEPLFFEVLNTPQDKRKNAISSLYEGEDGRGLTNTIPFLNGGLFDPHADDFYQNKPQYALKIPDHWFKDFFTVLEQYNFTIDENTATDIDIAVDPEMLGRIFENLLAEINPETGETARKATGSYYTPREIVDYMVDQSLRYYLHDKTGIPQEAIQALLSYTENDPVSLTEVEKEKLIAAIDEVKIIDPACGSGAFPMGILQKTLLILQKIDPRSEKWLEKQLAKIQNEAAKREFHEKLKGENWDYVHKLGIVQNAIYGVDIQPIAVEISKLRFFLSLIVDERIDDAKPNRGIKPLPNLEFKFVAANSLIGLPEQKGSQISFSATRDVEQLKRLRDEYLQAYGEDKKRIEREFKETQNRLFQSALNWREKNRNTQALHLSTWDPFSNKPSDWFDSGWMFGVDGFDIVIANPPYVQIKQISWNDRKIYGQKFKSAVGRFNLFYFFLELSSNLTKKSGVSAFIVPDRLLLNTQCDELRKWLLNEQTIIEIDSFAEGVFEAVVDSIIIIYKNIQSRGKDIKVKNQTTLNTLNQTILNQDNAIKIPVSYFLNSPSNQFDLSYNLFTAKLIEKIKFQSIELGEISEIKDGIIQSKIPDILFLKKPIDKWSKKLLFGKDVNRYRRCFNSNWVNYKPEEMMKIELQRNGGGLRLRNKTIFERKKILTRQTADEIIAAYDDDNFYYSNTLHGTTITDKQYDPLYVLAILNSRLITWYYRSTTTETGKIFAQVKIKILRQIPIKTISPEDQTPFIALVNKILALTDDADYLQNPAKQAKVREYQRQIDEMVYELYGLNEEERRVVEGK